MTDFGNFHSERHAHYCGWVAGALIRSGLNVTPVSDGDNSYTDRILLTMPNGEQLELIVPEPPEGWTLD
jgi:hypothetical protein